MLLYAWGSRHTNTLLAQFSALGSLSHSLRATFSFRDGPQLFSTYDWFGSSVQGIHHKTELPNCDRIDTVKIIIRKTNQQQQLLEKNLEYRCNAAI